MNMEHSPKGTGPPPRRGPNVDLDPNGIVTAKSPDVQRFVLGEAGEQELATLKL